MTYIIRACCTAVLLWFAIGEAAAEALGQMIDDPETQPVRRIVPTRLVVRSSTQVNGAPRERTLASDKEVR